MGFFLKQKKRKKKWVKDCFVQISFSLLVTHRSQKDCTIVVYRVEAYIFNFCCTAKQREVQTCSPQLYTSKTAGLIMLLTCVSLGIYLQTLKQRHSIRIWSWEIWWRLKWIDTLGVRWWLSAKDDGTTNASSLEHQGWVVENYSTTMYTRGTLF